MFMRFMRFQKFKRFNGFNAFKRLKLFFVFGFLNLLSFLKFRMLTLPSPLGEGLGKGASNNKHFCISCRKICISCNLSASRVAKSALFTK